MERATITWMVLARQLDDVTVGDRSGPAVALVLDTDTGLVRGVGAGDTTDEALTTACGMALTHRAAELKPGPPRRVLCPAHLLTRLPPVLEHLIGSEAPRVEVIVPGEDAEDVFDSLVGAIKGRAQPSDPPDPEDWAQLISQCIRFRKAEPWRRRSDADWLLLDLTLEGQTSGFAAVVMGEAGVQHGLAVYEGDVPDLNDGPGDSVVLMLDRREELPPELVAKAERYGWPVEDPMLPAFLSSWDGEVQEISRDDAHVLTAALAAVTDLDQQPLRAVAPGTPPLEVRGAVRLAGGDEVSYVVRPRVATQPVAGDLSLAVHTADPDLIPDNTTISLGHTVSAGLEALRAAARVCRPAPADAPPRPDTEVATLVLHPPPGAGDPLVQRLLALDPFTVAFTDMGSRPREVGIAIAGAEGAVFVMTLPQGSEAVRLFQQRMRRAGGHHVIVVADPSAAHGDGEVHGIVECHQPPSAMPPSRAGQQRAQPRKKKPKRRR